MVWPYIAAAGIGFVLALTVRSIIKSYRNTSLVVLGQRASGKTTLIKYLMTGSVSQKYAQTLKPEKITGKPINLKELGLDIRNVVPEMIVDFPGDQQSIYDWEAECKEVDRIFYLFDMRKLVNSNNSEHKERAQNDLQHIRQWVEGRRKPPKSIILIATHCDKIRDYWRAGPEEREAYTDVALNMPEVQNLMNLAGGSKLVSFVAGSQIDPQETQKLVGRILHAGARSHD